MQSRVTRAAEPVDIKGAGIVLVVCVDVLGGAAELTRLPNEGASAYGLGGGAVGGIPIWVVSTAPCPPLQRR